MAHWIECPTCATDWDTDTMDPGSIEDTARAFQLAEAGPELLEACLRARIAIHDVLECGLMRVYVNDEMSILDLLDTAIANATPKEADNEI